jgi:hypothetical protein
MVYGEFLDAGLMTGICGFKNLRYLRFLALGFFNIINITLLAEKGDSHD